MISNIEIRIGNAGTVEITVSDETPPRSHGKTGRRRINPQDDLLPESLEGFFILRRRRIMGLVVEERDIRPVQKPGIM